MRIIICIKPVRSDLVYCDENTAMKMLMNPYDLLAFKKILKLKQYIDCHITCLSMGIKSAQEMLLRCIACGADEAILLNDIAFSGSDTLATSYILKKGISKIGQFDLIVSGAQAIDGETGQVVYGLAEQLRLPCVTEVEQILSVNEHELIMECINNQKCLQLSSKFPTMISFRGFTTIQENISLIKLKQANRKGIKIWGKDDLDIDVNKCGQKGSRTKVIEMRENLIKKECVEIFGSSEEKAKMLSKIINKIGNEI